MAAAPDESHLKPHEAASAVVETASPARVASPAYQPSLTGGTRVARARQKTREFMRPERLREFGKTLSLVAPLTLLIWIWAEREQTQGSKESPERKPFTMMVKSADVSRAVSLTGDQNASLTVGLSGPKVGFVTLGDTLANDPMQRRIAIEIAENLEPGPHTVPIDVSIINQQKIFRDAGLTVETVDPAFVQVYVDRQVERELPVVLPPEVAEAVSSTSIEPKTVKVSGPERVIRQLEASGGLKAEVDITNLVELRKNPGRPIENVPLRPIEGATGVSFSTATITRVVLQPSQEETFEFPSLVVNKNLPVALNVVATVTPETLTGVRVIGPADVLKQLRDEKITPKPYAMVTILRPDQNTKGQRTPVIMDLPAGVRVVKDSVKPVTFDVSEVKTDVDGRPIP